MTDRPKLSVVGKAEPEPDAELAEMIARAAERMAAAAKATDGIFWLVTVVDDEVGVVFSGGKLEAAVVAEMVAAEFKAEAVGL